MVRKIAVCDDSSLMLRQIAGYLDQLQGELPCDICPAYYSSGEEVLTGLAPDTDLLLLDIAMDGINGVDCARELRRRGMNLPIVFITSMAEYALDGYAVHAFGYLLKPVTYADFASIIKEALAPAEAEPPKKLLIKTEDGLRTVDPAELIYAEVYQHKTSFILKSGRVEGNLQLAVVEPLLLPLGFFRCHKSYLIAFNEVSFIGRDSLTMTNGSVIPLSKHRRKAFLSEYGSFMGVRF
ncbi:MAG: response regulator transcription factor [Faecalibacterium sp.]|nr:response regulator transcription factor [Faecalibacterium sp.]